ncbi:L-type lectin-domain containing receptor kinase IX.1-like [Alnus glutinosa]|uniref:L-type lectin-domain containing receptor kinase IX.1-like n=1 Tax=Alnus glutinosa TaxID=3517 RepID=UPI002D7698CB|nr:L-type lectin-domain containing receptor kinase IX.1-like [Alnus glutinosa]
MHSLPIPNMDLRNLTTLWFLSLVPCCLLFHLPLHHALSFKYPNFTDSSRLILNGTAAIQNGALSLTGNNPNEDFAAGRAVYIEQLHLYDPITGNSTDFTTKFSFKISTVQLPGQDGLAFFLAPNGSLLPDYASGGCLALFSQCDNFIISRKELVAVEFDTYKNTWDESDEHVGININSIKSNSTQTLSRSMKDGTRVDAIIRYNSKANDLSVYWSFPDDPFVSLPFHINLTTYLPEWVSIGFAAGSNYDFETHEILSWEFTTELLPAPETPDSPSAGLIVACVIGGLLLACGIVLVLVFVWRKRTKGKGKEGVKNVDPMEREIEHTGPKRFSYDELVRATNDFAEEGKLGEGGFGGVYKGFLSDLQQFVAVKKVSRPSDQGKKAYTTEIKIISVLRHKNMVQLIGWCHEKGALLLVYEFMPNGSLDFHLFGGRTLLNWEVRYKIALGLASALLYLHEESGQYVVHRDIKSSNIMLDSDFNAKLGDFGLARLMDGEAGVKTTGLAGTWGYIAPEYASTGKATKESDVFGFGVVVLEIACGKRSTEAKYEGPHVPIAGWVWEAYGNERLHEAVDSKLLEFDMKQVECMMIVGLWCAHPDQSLRPSIRQALQVLNFDAPLPNLPKKMPVANYNVPVDVRLESTDSASTMSLSSINIGR